MSVPAHRAPRISRSRRWRYASAVVATAALTLVAGPANASVTFDPTCSLTKSNGTGVCGFVGKGDVQTALGYNNTQMQKNASGLLFTWSQPSSQALTQPATQAGSQAGSQAGIESVSQSLSETLSQAITREVSCTIDGQHSTSILYGSRDGARSGKRTGEQTGTRTGTRDGSRTGSRTGSRAGTVSGTVSYVIDYDARVKNQIDGFFLTKATSTGFVAYASPVWEDYVFGAYNWGGYVFGDYTWAEDYTWDNPQWDDPAWSSTITWGGWNNDDGTHGTPRCLSHDPAVGDLSDVIVEGEITEGGITEGDIADLGVTDGEVTDGEVTDGLITPGDIVSGIVTPSGSATLYVNGHALN